MPAGSFEIFWRGSPGDSVTIVRKRYEDMQGYTVGSWSSLWRLVTWRLFTNSDLNCST